MLGATLKNARREKGWSLRQAEEETGVSNGYLSLLENGKAKAPSPTVLDALAAKYALSFDDLMAMAGHPSGASRAERDASRTPDEGLGPVVRSISEDTRYERAPLRAAHQTQELVVEIRSGSEESRTTNSGPTNPSVPFEHIVSYQGPTADASDNHERAEVIQMLLEDTRGLSLDQLGHVRAYVAGLKAPRAASR